jgi:hypothetical protein
MPTATGSFDVDIDPQPPYLEQDGLKLSLNLVQKEISGDMIGSSEARMITAFTPTPGSAGYVAIEHFAGSVHGKSGSFALQHNGAMNKGDGQLTVTIIPDSGTGDLAGISGALEIHVEDGQHSYTLNYELP